MRLHVRHGWNFTTGEARALQMKLRMHVERTDHFVPAVKRGGAAD